MNAKKIGFLIIVFAILVITVLSASENRPAPGLYVTNGRSADFKFIFLTGEQGDSTRGIWLCNSSQHPVWKGTMNYNSSNGCYNFSRNGAFFTVSNLTANSFICNVGGSANTYLLDW